MNRFVLEVCFNRFQYEIESRSPLEGICCYDSPQSFITLSSFNAARALGYMTIYDHKPYCLFCHIVGRVYPRGRYTILTSPLQFGQAVNM